MILDVGVIMCLTFKSSLITVQSPLIDKAGVKTNISRQKGEKNTIAAISQLNQPKLLQKTLSSCRTLLLLVRSRLRKYVFRAFKVLQKNQGHLARESHTAPHSMVSVFHNPRLPPLPPALFCEEKYITFRPW